VRPRRSPPQEPATPDPAESDEGFDLYRAGQGCRWLYELFVPIECTPMEVDGRQAIVVRFDDDGTGRDYRTEFRPRITTPWCYEARRHPGSEAPELVFAVDGDARRVQTWSCEQGAFEPEHRPDRMRLLRGGFEGVE